MLDLSVQPGSNHARTQRDGKHKNCLKIMYRKLCRRTDVRHEKYNFEDSVSRIEPGISGIHTAHTPVER